MGRINADINKNIECFDLRDINWYKTAVRIMYQEVASQGSSSIVVDAASPIGHITHDESLSARAESGQDVRDGSGEKQQTFWEL